MGYDRDESMVRVDFFKPSGKWYSTEAIKWITWNGAERLDHGPHMLIHDAFREALSKDLQASKLMQDGMFAVCLDPYHEFSFPIILWSLDQVKNAELATGKVYLNEKILGIPQ